MAIKAAKATTAIASDVSKVIFVLMEMEGIMNASNIQS